MARPKSVARFMGWSTGSAGAPPVAGRKPASASRTEAAADPGRCGLNHHVTAALLSVVAPPIPVNIPPVCLFPSFFPVTGALETGTLTHRHRNHKQYFFFSR